MNINVFYLAAIATLISLIIYIIILTNTKLHKKYKDQQWHGGQIQASIFTSIIFILIFSIFINYFPAQAINGIIHVKKENGAILPKFSKNESYKNYLKKLYQAGFKDIQPLTDFPLAYLEEANAALIDVEPEPGYFYSFTSEIKIKVRLVKPRAGVYPYKNYKLAVKDKDKNSLTEIELYKIKVINTKDENGKPIINLRTYLRITNRLDETLKFPPLNNNGVIAHGVVLTDNNSKNGIGYEPIRSASADINGPRWDKSKPLRIRKHSITEVYIEFKNIRKNAGEFQLALNFGTSLTDYGKLVGIRLSNVSQ